MTFSAALSIDLESYWHAELLRRAPWMSALDSVRFGALLNMAFQMGVDGLLGFKNTLTTIEAGRYESAAEQMLQSRWAKQTPERAKRSIGGAISAAVAL